MYINRYACTYIYIYTHSYLAKTKHAKEDTIIKEKTYKRVWGSHLYNRRFSAPSWQGLRPTYKYNMLSWQILAYTHTIIYDPHKLQFNGIFHYKTSISRNTPFMKPPSQKNGGVPLRYVWRPLTPSWPVRHTRGRPEGEWCPSPSELDASEWTILLTWV